MKNFLLILGISLLLTGVQAQETEIHPNRILVTFAEDNEVFAEMYEQRGIELLTGASKIQRKTSNDLLKTQTFMQEYGLSSIKKLAPYSAKSKAFKNGEVELSIPRNRLFILEAESSSNVRETIELLQKLPGVESAEPDHVTKGGGNLVSVFPVMGASTNQNPNDPFYSFQWGLNNTGQIVAGHSGVAGEDINPDGAWEITEGSEDIIVAVLDTGLPDNVPDMEGRVLAGYNYVSDNTSTADDHGHGTSVASIALSTGNNNSMISGVDWNAKIMPIKVLDENNSGFNSYSVNGVYFAVDNGADVINISVGSTGDDKIYRDAVQYAAEAGVTILACMMNNNTDTPYYPAAYESVIAIGATNEDGDRAQPFIGGGTGSNFGDHIDLVAPGNLIASLKHDDNANVSLWSGISQATPFVTGVVSLMLSVNPDLNPEEVRLILKETARGDGTWDQYMGWGKLDATAAVQMAQDFETATSSEVDPKREKPYSFKLNQNYPNPFNPTTRISFQLPQSGEVSLKVFDMLGREVASLLSNTSLSAGDHTVNFDASELTTGLYIYQLRAGNFTTSRKMTLIK